MALKLAAAKEFGPPRDPPVSMQTYAHWHARASLCHRAFIQLQSTKPTICRYRDSIGWTAVKKNIIILTHGWTGSSVFAALLGRAGYWLGSSTVQKRDYDTFENADLVACNRELLRLLATGIDHEHHFEFDDVSRIAQASAGLDPEPYRDFLSRCEANGPWLWKDPRLTWTIRVWAKVLDLERTSFLILTRDDLQAWVSSNQRRHIQSLRFTQNYNHGITHSNLRFLEDCGLPHLEMSFETLLLQPENALIRLNTFFDVDLSMDDLCSVCNVPLCRKSRSWKDVLIAALIYAKNYGERDGRPRNRQQSRIMTA